ncbi:MAG: 16S rRNA (cytidine(1402)-2'-O)-methyltransferase [Clostridia bacterium]|nr:16S rRNA (cytidine(1402)-2'-O)-methyltransferase [Clostridia bacterium]
MSGNLYLVATPIGNLEDITYRAIRILKEVDLIAAEDTRQTLKLLNHYEIKKPLISYHRHNEELKVDGLIKQIKEGKNIAIVSDAGTPAICDPGEVIVKEAIKENINIIPIPGACAFVNALITSGLDTSEFVFYGFLSINKKIRKEKLKEIEKENRTIILYEAPHKIKATLEDLSKILGDRKVVIARELTKIHEEFIRGNINEIIEKYKDPKGEHIILIEGSNFDSNGEEQEALNNMTIEEHYKYYEKQGLQKNEIIKKVAKDRNVTKNEIYKLFI